MGGHTRSSLANDLTSLGVSAGDCLFVHASFKSLGPVEGGALTMVEAFEEVLGPDGLLLMPSFNLIGDRDVRASTWDVNTTPSTVGWLTEFFRLMDGTYRSDHYSHSTAARGRGASDLVSGHRSTEGMSSPWDRDPWGKTYGIHSPMMRAYDRGGKILMLGGDYTTSTYCHVVEVTYWSERLVSDKEAPFVWLDRERLGDFWESEGKTERGRIGDSQSRLIDIRAYVDGLLAEVRRNPDAYDRVKLGTR